MPAERDPWEQEYSKQPSVAAPPQSAIADPWEQDYSKAQSVPAPGPGERLITGLYESTLGPIVETIKDPRLVVESTKQVLGIPQLQNIGRQIQAGNWGPAAAEILDYARKGPGGRLAESMATPIVEDVRAGNIAGAVGRTLGTAGMLAGPEALAPVGRTLRTVIPPAVRGGVKGLKSSRLSAATAATVGGMIQGPEAAALGAAAVTVPAVIRGAVRGVKAALAERVEAAAQAAAAARAVPETIITRVPETAPGPIPIERRLPPGREPIVTPAPEPPPDTSFVRSVPAELPEIIPQNLRTRPAAQSLAEQMRAEMEASGTLAPGEAAPPAVAEPNLPTPTRQDLARAAKSDTYVRILKDYVEPNEVKQLTPEQWKTIAGAHGLRVPSETTMAEIEFKLRKIDQARKNSPAEAKDAFQKAKRTRPRPER